MWRSLRAITLAIRFASGMNDASAVSYAKVVQEEAAKRDFDPFTLVAMVRNESRWRAAVTNGVNCVGLGQVCLTSHPACRDGLTSASCLAKRAQLQDGHYNLHVIADSITRNRAFCKKKTGRALWRHWLASHGGFNSPSRGIWCGQKKSKRGWRDQPVPKALTRIMSFRGKLIAKFGRK